MWRSILVLALPALLGACSLTPVQPWERGTLAREDMQLVPDPVEGFFDNKVYFSREASSGGGGAGGGGCGCN